MMRKKLLFFITPFFVLIFYGSSVYAAEPIEKRLDRIEIKLEKLDDIEAQVKENRERLIRLEEGQKALNQRIEDGLGNVNKRIDGGLKNVSQRIDEGLKNVNKRIDDIYNLLYVILGGLVAVLLGMVGLTGFVIWDRRTAVAPVARKNKELEEREELLEKALREYAKKEPKLAEVLRSSGFI